MLLLGFSLLTPYASAWGTQPSNAETARIERLVALCKLWGAVRYFHPYLAYRADIDWDKALITALPKVSAAENSIEYADAVEEMLSTLGDPVTRVLKNPSLGVPDADRQKHSDRLTPDGILAVTIGDYADFAEWDGSMRIMTAIRDRLADAHGVVFDLRAKSPVASDLLDRVTRAFVFSGIESRLTSIAVTTPGLRRRIYWGFYQEEVQELAWYVYQIRTIPPAPDAKDRPTVFLVNSHSAIPAAALALQQAGKAQIVAEGTVDEAPMIASHRLQLADGVEVQFRTSELVFADSSVGIQPDITLPSSANLGEDSAGFQAALHAVRNFHPSLVHRKIPPVGLIRERSYSEMQYPPLEYRVLAAFRIWTVINYFFPYKDLMGEDWNGVLREFIPRMEKAATALEYNLAVSEMMTHLHDGHSRIDSPVIRNYAGAAPPPVFVRMIEGLPVVTGFTDDQAAKASGIEVGDIILKVDGEEAMDRLARRAKYVHASTPQALMYYDAGNFLRGAEGSTAAVTVRDTQDQVREIRLPRKAEFAQTSPGGRRGEIVTTLDGNIGYIDLDRLPESQMGEAMEKLKDTRAIIFDMRGYPQVSWGYLWLSPKAGPAGIGDFPIVIFADGPTGQEEGLLGGGAVEQSVWHRQVARGMPQKWQYKGRTVMLIDERAASAAESDGSTLKASTGAKFIGSPTAGQDGGVADFSVPGGITVSFSGMSARHADGRQLQRVGLLPDIEVKPTIAGIRAGRDEVLEKAVEYLQRETNTAAPMK